MFGMPISFYYGIAFVAFLAYVYAYTPLGRHMLFVGSSKEVARLAGIRVEWIRQAPTSQADCWPVLPGCSWSPRRADSTPPAP
ncbi:ABC transporter permease subunit [Streptomyces sp. INA 01156]